MDNYIMEIVLRYGCPRQAKVTRRTNSTLKYSERFYIPTDASYKRLQETIEREVNAGRAEIRLCLPFIFVTTTTTT